jgi:hypothetical protein
MCSRTSNTNPEEPCAYLKSTAGWVTPSVISSFHAGLAVPTSYNFCYKVEHPSLANEYYLIENRQKEGRDIDLADDGLAIWHIETNGNNSLNHMLPDSHYVVTLVQADGLWEYERDLDGSDDTDLWAAPDYVNLSPCTSPNNDWWDGSESGFMITDISASASVMTFTFSPSNETPVAQCTPFAADADEDCCITVGVADVDGGSYDPNGETDIASLCITAVDGDPVGCEEQVEICGQGMHTVTLTITDVCGESDQCVASVEVVNHPPVAVCQAFVDTADENCCIMVHLADIDGGTYDPDGAGDIETFCITTVDGSDVGCLDSVLVCGVGAHSIAITATDWCGETSSCDADVTVIDATPPEITVTLNRDVLWPPNHKMADIIATVVVTDNCDPDPAWVLLPIWSDEPENGTGDGDTPNDVQGAAVGTPDTEFRLRSERAGGGDGRVYTITYMATDDSGNSASATVYVRVPHDQGGSALASHGFSADGTALDPEADVFGLVVPSSVDLDATAIEPSAAYVGNLKGVILPESHVEYDANQDGLPDLVLWYSTADAEALFGGTVASASNPWANVAFDPEAPDLPPDPADLLAGFGPVGLHYVRPGSVDCLVPNIFQLGEPLVLEIALDATSGVGDGGVAPTALAVMPNPAGRSVQITYSLVASGPATLRIYNARGALVRTVRDGDLTAGTHQAAWDGRDAAGYNVAAGIYFVRLDTRSVVITEKLLLLH